MLGYRPAPSPQFGFTSQNLSLSGARVSRPIGDNFPPGGEQIYSILESPMVLITAYLKPHRLEEVKTAVADLGVTGLTVNDVRGCGSSPEKPRMFAGQQVHVTLPARSKLTVAVTDDLREAVIQAILENAQTGEPGDGKIFVEPLADAIRIRTGQRGPDAV
jgi:nitrogen regulatory protein PII